MYGVSEENVCDVKYRPKNVVVKPNSKDEHSIYVDIEFEIFTRVYENKKIDVIQDMYSPSRNLSFGENNISTMVNLRNTEDIINVRDKVKLEDTEYLKICNAQVVPIVSKTDISNDRVRFEGDIDLNFILTNNNEDNAVTLNRKVPFDFTQEIDGINKDSKIYANIVPKFKEFIANDMEVTTKIDLELNTSSYNLEKLNVINNIEEKDEEDVSPYSMVIYFVKPGDTLWKIAKRYRSTVDDIVRVNNIEDPDRINVGMQLFIPRCSVCRT